MLLPRPGEAYRAQVVGRLTEKMSLPETDFELQLVLRIEKRKRKGEFFLDHSDYNPKPLLDVFFRRIQETCLETNRFGEQLLDTDRDKEN